MKSSILIKSDEVTSIEANPVTWGIITEESRTNYRTVTVGTIFKKVVTEPYKVTYYKLSGVDFLGCTPASANIMDLIDQLRGDDYEVDYYEDVVNCTKKVRFKPHAVIKLRSEKVYDGEYIQTRYIRVNFKTNIELNNFMNKIHKDLNESTHVLIKV